MRLRVPSLTVPGPKTGLAYVWLILLSPVLLLLFSLGVLSVGLWREVSSVAATGAVGVVASLLLPRTQGPFEVGPGGVKGDLESEIFREIVGKGLDSGLSAAEAVELANSAITDPLVSAAAEEVARPEPFLFTHRYPISSPSSAWTEPRVRPANLSTLVEVLTSQTVGRLVLLRAATKAIVERVAAERNWTVEREVRIDAPAETPSAGFTNFDFVIQPGADRPVFIDTSVFDRPESAAKRARRLAAIVRDRNPSATLLVVPDEHVSSVMHRPGRDCQGRPA